LELLLKDVTEEMIEGTKRRGKRRKQLLDGLQKKRRYWELKKENSTVFYSTRTTKHPIQSDSTPNDSESNKAGTSPSQHRVEQIVQTNGRPPTGPGTSRKTYITPCKSTCVI
jgi:hypothetical protein